MSNANALSPRDKMAAARLIACERFPYFRSAIVGMVPKEAKGLGTFGVSRHGVLYWDPAMLDVWTVQETAAVLVHEGSHLLRRHAERRERMGAEADLWNQAGDYEINDDLEAAGLPLPMKPFVPCIPRLSKLENGLTAEEYYHILQQQQRAQQAQSEADGQGKKGVGGGHCGSCAGHAIEGEEPGGGEHARSEADMNRIRRTVAEQIRKQGEKGRGTVPAGWLRWADGELAPPKVPWRKKLAHATRAAIAYRPGCVDLHWTRPSRRQAGVGFGPGKPVLPALRAPLPRVGVVIDTSGSMGAEDIHAAVAECRGVLAACGAAVDLAACDAAVHELRPVARWQDIPKLIKGGGGTDMRPALEAMQKRTSKLDVVIVMTDGWIGDPGPQPPFRVIWLIVGKHGNRTPQPWGEMIVVDDT